MSAEAHTESPLMMAERHPAAGGRPGNVLVVGGYGEVGRNVARRLASFLPGRVVVAGRNLGRAQAFAAELGRGGSGRAVDTGAAAATLDLSNLSTVVMCVDQADTGLVERCLLERIDYVDVTAHQPSLDAIERLDRLACARQSTAVVSVGLCPGVTNLLAAHAARAFDTLSKIDIFLMIGSGDRHGQVLVRAEGRVSRETVVREFAASSRGEAQVTGLIAAETVRMLMEGGRRGGVFHLEQLADRRRMLTQLRDAIAGTTLRL